MEYITPFSFSSFVVVVWLAFGFLKNLALPSVIMWGPPSLFFKPESLKT